MQEENRLQEKEAPSPVPTGSSSAPEAGGPPPAELKQQLEQAETKLAELQDAFLRAKAEAENQRRRSREEVARATKFGIEAFAETLLPVKDNLETALKIETPSVESLKEGVEMTLKQLDNAFAKNGLTEIAPAPRDKLDPMKHEAVSLIPSSQEANTIVSVLQKGYMIADRLLRPALVIVSQGPAGGAESGQG